MDHGNQEDRDVASGGPNERVDGGGENQVAESSTMAAAVAAASLGGSDENNEEKSPGERKQQERGEATQRYNTASDAPNGPAYSPSDIHQLLRLINRTENETTAGSNPTPLQHQNYAALGTSYAPTVPTMPPPQAPSSLGTFNPAAAGYTQNQNQDTLAAVFSSPQVIAALAPLFLQCLQTNVQPPPTPPALPPTQPTMSLLPPLLQLLQQLLPSTQQAPLPVTTINPGFDLNAFLQLYAHFQSNTQQSPQQQSRGENNSRTSVVVPPALLLPVNTFAVPASTGRVSWPWNTNPLTTTAGIAPMHFPSVVAAKETGPQQPRTASDANQGRSPAATTTATTTKDEPPHQPRKKRKYNLEAFPQKLHRLITEAAAHGNESIVCFTDTGKQFQILNTTEFERLLPGYFRHSNVSSFKRSLHLYGFVRVCGTWEEGTYEHPLFQRDHPELCKNIDRVDRGFGSLY